jgi:tetratricopeptide (TPR) repeat protein
MKPIRISQIYKYLTIFLAMALINNVHGQISLFYPDWYENPTFVVQNNYSASSCVAVQNNNLQSARDEALKDTREEITNYLNGLPSDEDGAPSIAARGVYLSNSQRVLDQDLGEEFFCVLGSLPYNRIEEAMKTGLTQSELEQALKDLAPALNLAAKGIITSPTEPLEFYTNALAYAEINETNAAYNSFTQLITDHPRYWDVHESFIQFAREFGLEAAAKKF